MRETRIAKPYARALYSAATEEDILDRIVEDVNQVLQLTQDSEDFDQFLTNPILSPQFKSEMFQQLLSEAVQPLTLNFLLLLALKQRERSLVAILQMFLEIVDLQAGRLVAQVTSAVPLTDAQKTTLSQQLSNYSEAEVRLELNEDATIQGGVIVRLGDTVFDGSIASQLQRMRTLLARG
ncbi:ATP synthase subunit delta [Geodia barretti]|uniref:Oligomycin sensitivity conferral protein n=1 Tax=Geodia barretti TaxID=519541 RepID=A0AA35ST68_GEOBA|nr:ATP synthase subunit delta [Geodia barretti]